MTTEVRHEKRGGSASSALLMLLCLPHTVPHGPEWKETTELVSSKKGFQKIPSNLMNGTAGKMQTKKAAALRKSADRNA